MGIIEKSEQRIVEKILGFCDFTYQTVDTPQKGYRNTSYRVQLTDASWINVIIFKNEAGIAKRMQQADTLSDYLCATGFPTRQSLSPIVKLHDKRATRYARCYTYLPGRTIPWEAYTMKHIKLLGETLANLHKASVDIKLRSRVIDESLVISANMRSYFRRAGVAKALESKLELHITPHTIAQLEHTLGDASLLALEDQALHMDFVRGNILFKTNPTNETPEISGIIDFEKASNGPVVFDIARTLAFLLVDCKFKDPHKVYKYFIQSGYIKRGQGNLDIQQLQLLSKLTRFYLMYDFYKFLRHNPYESLHQNEHFLRTRDFLVQDGIIKYKKPEGLTVTNLEGAH